MEKKPSGTYNNQNKKCTEQRILKASRERQAPDKGSPVRITCYRLWFYLQPSLVLFLCRKTESFSDSQPRCAKKTPFHSPPLEFLQSHHSLYCNVCTICLGLWKKYDTNVSFKAKHTTVSGTSHFEPLWVFIVFFYSGKKHFGECWEQH